MLTHQVVKKEVTSSSSSRVANKVKSEGYASVVTAATFVPMSDDGMSSGDEDEDDAVVCELPIYLSNDTASSSQLHLLSFALRDTSRPYECDLGKVSTARIKPKQQALQIDYDIVAPHDPERSDEFKTFQLKSRKIRQGSNYAVGCIRDGQVFVSPLSSIQEMYPDLKFVDESARRRAAAEQGEDMDDEAAAAAPAAPLKQVLLKAARNKSANAPQRKSYQNMKQEWDAEKWISLQVHEQNTEEASNAREAFTGPANVSLDIPFDEKSTSYLSAMSLNVPGASKSGKEVAAKIVKFLKNAGVATFTQICSHIDDSCSMEELDESLRQRILKTLNQRAVLLQGSSWVAKSALSLSGRATLCRDFLLTIFDERSRVKLSEFSSMAGLDMDLTMKIISELAIYERDTREWVFKGDAHSRDVALNEYPDLLEKQVDLMKNMLESSSSLQAPSKTCRHKPPKQEPTANNTNMFVEKFESDNDDSESKEDEGHESSDDGKDDDDDEAVDNGDDVVMKPRGNDDRATTVAAAAGSAAAVKSPNSGGVVNAPKTPESPQKVAATDTKTEEELSSHAVTFVDMMLSKHGVCSIEFLQRQSKEVNGEKRFKQDALRAVIDQNCRYINETLVCRGSLNNPSVDKFRDALIGLFAQDTSKKHRKSEIRAHVLKVTDEALPDRLYTKLTREIAVSLKSGGWTLKSGDYEI